MLQNAIRNLKNQEGEGEGGFTLIELLVVILIIGILAAIALPTFLGQSDKAKDSAAKSDVRNAVTQMESCLVDNPMSVCDSSAGAGTSITQNGVVVSNSAASGTYTLTQTSKSGDATHFAITKGNPGTYVRSCDQAGKGGCSATAPGAGGVTNYAGSW